MFLKSPILDDIVIKTTTPEEFDISSDFGDESETFDETDEIDDLDIHITCLIDESKYPMLDIFL